MNFTEIANGGNIYGGMINGTNGTISGTVGEPSSSKIPLKKRVRISYAESEESDSGYKEQPKRAIKISESIQRSRE